MTVAQQLSRFLSPVFEKKSAATLRRAAADGTLKVVGRIEGDVLVQGGKQLAKQAPADAVKGLLAKKPARFESLGQFKGFAQALADFVVGLQGKVNRALNGAAQAEKTFYAQRNELGKPLMAARERLTHVQADAVTVKPLIEQATKGQAPEAMALATRYKALSQDAVALAEQQVTHAQATFNAQLKPFNDRAMRSRQKVNELSNPMYEAINAFDDLRRHVTPEQLPGLKANEVFEAGVFWSEQRRRFK